MSGSTLLLAVLALICVAGVISDGRYTCGNRSNSCKKPCRKCEWLKPKTVTLVVRNLLREPTFEETVTLNCTRSKYLFEMMQEAAEENAIFRFNAKYFGKELGFFIEAINNIFGTYDVDKSFWEILEGHLNQTQLGASSYVPKPYETITFNLTQGGHTL